MVKKDNRIRLLPDVDLSLDYYVSEQNADVNPGNHTERNTVITDLAREFLRKKGHYPPKGGLHG